MDNTHWTTNWLPITTNPELDGPTEFLVDRARAQDPTDDAMMKLRVTINGEKYTGQMVIPEDEFTNMETFPDYVQTRANDWARSVKRKLEES